MHGTANATYSVDVTYPGIGNDKLDKQLEQLAQKHGGQWFASGRDFVQSQRDIEFHFTAKDQAKAFAEATVAIPGISVSAIAEESV